MKSKAIEMKILFITQIYPINPKKQSPDKRLALHYYVREWIKTHEIEVIRLHNFPFWYAWIFPFLGYPKKYDIDGVQVHHKLVIKYAYLKRNFFFIRRFVRNSFHDVTIAHIPDSLMAAAYLKRKFGIPYVAGIQKTDYKKSGLKASGSIQPFFKHLLEEAIMVAFWSDFLKSEFLQSMPSIAHKSIDMPGGITADWLGQSSGFKNWKSERWNFATVARLTKQKRISTILSGLSFTPHLQSYHLIGDGPEKNALFDLSDQLGLKNQILFHGHLESDPIRDILDQCQVMILLSTNETFGLVYLEAMARGCIVIGTKGEGIDGVIRHNENGFLCESDPGALKSLIEIIKNLPAERLEEISKSAVATALDYQYKDLAKSYLSELEKYI